MLSPCYAVPCRSETEVGVLAEGMTANSKLAGKPALIAARSDDRHVLPKDCG
jgi:hypothetical protein